MVWRSKAIDFATANSFPDKNSAKKDDKALCSNPESSRFCGLWATSAPSPRQVPVFRSRIQQVLWSSGPHSLPPPKNQQKHDKPLHSTPESSSSSWFIYHPAAALQLNRAGIRFPSATIAKGTIVKWMPRQRPLPSVLL